MALILWTALCLLGWAAQECHCQGSSEARLYSHLMAGYRPEYLYMRPVEKSGDTVTVGVGLGVIDIEKEKDSDVFVFYTFDRLMWTDVYLKWNPLQFGQLKRLQLPSDQIWQPDITLYNSLDPNENRMKSNAVVQSTGNVLVVPRSRYRVRCTPSGVDYSCKLKLGSWVYDGNQLVIERYANSSADFEDYAGAWEVKDHDSEVAGKYYDCCPDVPYYSITFTFTLSAKEGANGASGLTFSSVLGLISVLVTLLLRI